MRPCIVIPAYEAERTLRSVVGDLREAGIHAPIYVIDDGSRDRTTDIARELRVRVIRHDYNRGKGAALRTAMGIALGEGHDTCVTCDADGQHPATAVKTILEADTPRDSLVLGIRNLVTAGAPRANQVSNGISNFFLSWFSGRPLKDTQCGLRRYPIPETLALRAKADRYAYEAEVILRAIRAGMRVIEIPIDVYYPPENERITHFDSVRDPARIVFAVVRTMASR
jgi:glycosyltransferase involved in cell wall biosynthesis